MTSASPTRFATLALLGGAVIFASCREEKKPGEPGPRVDLGITLRTSVGTVAALCQEAQSLLLRIAEPDRETTFVYSAKGDVLYGCGGACADPVIQRAFGAPTRVVVELLDIAPANFGPNETYSVVCRGVADARLPGEITVEGTAVEADVKVLRVGAVNPLFDGIGEHPTAHSLAGAPIRAVPPYGTLARTATGGGIVFAGGFVFGTNDATSDLHVFDPLALTMRISPEGLMTPRGGLSATAIDGPDGASSILFAGGAASPGSESWNHGEVHRGTSREVVSLHNRRSGHSAVYLPDYEDLPGLTMGATPRNAVLLIGGCSQGQCVPPLTGSTPSTSTMEAVYLDRPSSANPSICLGTAGSLGSCSYASLESECGPQTAHLCAGPPRSLGAAGPLKGAPSVRLYTGQGYTAAGAATGDGWVLENQYFSDFDVLGGGRAVFAPAVATLGSSDLGIFGGYLSGGTSTALVVRVNPFLGDDRGPLRAPRGNATATALLDGRVAIIGGDIADISAPDYTNTVEIYDPAGVGTSAYLSRPGTTCTTAGDLGCETMANDRAGHAAVRIDGALSWLNGAVVIAGGKQASMDTVEPELFVPAYECGEDGRVAEPLRTQVDFCDRNRVGEIPTDPRTP